MNTREVRELWVRFFAERGHRNIPSSSLIPPPDEKTLLFANAGMNQMKPYFMGLSEPPQRRMTSIQKCFRTSDIEEVGDSSHCTFFEMLGNFSVGDYFKSEVIPWAWQLLTTSQPNGLGLDRDRLWVTIYEEDEEAYNLWSKVGLPDERIVRFDESENYWFMIKGGAGPCGPNTEIYYDFGPEFGCGQDDCKPPLHTPPDCGRFLEIWNLVFMALYQEEDGKTRRPLPMRNVDTGAGLERWTPVLLWQNRVDWQGNPKQWQQPPSIYDTDLFQPILAKVGELAGKAYDDATDDEKRAMRVVAEHARAATFLIADGVTPANDGRGYVLRRLIRRAAFHAHTLRLRGPNPLEWISVSVGALMHEHYPELLERASFISKTLADEEERFNRTLLNGRSALSSLHRLHQSVTKQLLGVADNPQIRQQEASSDIPLAVFGSTSLPEPLKAAIIRAYEAKIGGNYLMAASERLREVAAQPLPFTGEAAFVLWDTFGFPPELAREIAFREGFEVDAPERFEQLMEEQRARSRAAGGFEGGGERIQTYAELGLHPTEFVGYETTRSLGAVVAIVLNGTTIVRSLTPELSARTTAEIVLDRTPFYAEGGGQVGDRGEIVWPEGRFEVRDTQSVGEGGVSVHLGRLLEGTLNVGDPVEGRVNEDSRADTMRNHTATHILHAALRQVLGPHARQAGSLVTPDRLRFDFTHLEALTPEQLREVEALANKAVRENLPVSVDIQSYEDAIKGGALAFFGDKYADTVRVVGVCDVEGNSCFSKELCGGTHVHASGDVGAIVVTGESSIGAGLRRIEAVTGRAAAERIRQQEETLGRLSAALLVPPAEIEGRVVALKQEIDELQRTVRSLERRLARGDADSLLASAQEVGGVKMLVAAVGEAPNADFLRELGDGLKSKLGESVLLLAASVEGKPAFLAMATANAAKRCSAGDIVRTAAREAGGGGGGRPELAQGGGTDPAKIDAALAAARKLIEEKLAASS